MQSVSVKRCLSGAVPIDSEVEVRGWVRTRRDSKAGLSFVQISDGSCQGTLQVVAPNALPNYESGVLHLTAGASLIARGRLVASQGKGQTVELQAAEVDVVGLVDDPETYPIQPKQHSLEFLREVAHLRPRTNT
ncbi:MAG: asparagine--tRNA ligase, partial [Planctomycetes bacterium]|nr:asparagine--tRNA ligase [Planctomycetota bacterium]